MRFIMDNRVRLFFTLVKNGIGVNFRVCFDIEIINLIL